MQHSTQPFRGADMKARGHVTDHQLRHHHVRILPGVYLHEDVELTAFRTARAVWVWSKGRITLAGLSASAVWGTKWIDAHERAACNHPQRLHAPDWLDVYRDRLQPSDLRRRHGMTVTSPARTAYDVGRRLKLDRAVEVVDAIYQSTTLTRPELDAYAAARPHRRGMRRLRTVIALSDEGAESPWETRTRLAILREGLPRPDSQVTIRAADPGDPWRARVDMAWEKWRVVVEYEGDGHRSSAQLAKDIERYNKLGQLGWRVVRVKSHQLRPGIAHVVLGQIRDALRAGGAPV